jgi:uncharacterized protein (UPF0333 family)
MNTTKSVYNKLFKEEATELASHEVNLALTDDIKKLMQAALNDKNAYEAEALRAVDQIKKAKAIGINWRTNLQDASKKINELVNQAKAIGLEVPREITAYQDVVSKGIKDAADYVTKLNKLQMEIPLS